MKSSGEFVKNKIEIAQTALADNFNVLEGLKFERKLDQKFTNLLMIIKCSETHFISFVILFYLLSAHISLREFSCVMAVNSRNMIYSSVVSQLTNEKTLKTLCKESLCRKKRVYECKWTCFCYDITCEREAFLQIA